MLLRHELTDLFYYIYARVSRIIDGLVAIWDDMLVKRRQSVLCGKHVVHPFKVRRKRRSEGQSLARSRVREFQPVRVQQLSVELEALLFKAVSLIAHYRVTDIFGVNADLVRSTGK